jgi:methylase of polypeptide subunit release factors
MRQDDFVHWFEALEKRHLSELKFAEVRRAVQALSSAYIDRRANSALNGAGKRAAFALFFGPLHFLLVREIVRSLGASSVRKETGILDLGCGTGVAGAAWALEMNK